MLTQCPECKTTFRLHVKQLKAAGGKVRCSRCHTTFDALDNIFTSAPAPEKAPDPTPPPAPTPPPVTKQETSGKAPSDTPPPQKRSYRAEESTEDKDHSEREKISSIFDEVDSRTTQATNSDDDALDALIGELEESTTHHQTASTEDNNQPPPASDASFDSEDIFSAAFDSIDSPAAPDDALTINEPLPLVELDDGAELSIEPVEEEISIEAMEEEPLPLVELDDEAELSIEPVEEEISIEAVEEEPLPLVEPDDEAELHVEPVEEEISIEAVDEDLLPLVEPDDEAELSVEPLEEEISIEAVSDEALPLVEPDDEAELNFEAVKEQPEAPSDAELKALFEQTEAESDASAAVEAQAIEEPAKDTVKPAITGEEADSLEETPLTEQGELLDIFDEELFSEAGEEDPEEGAAEDVTMDTPQLPEELQEESTAAQPSTDPLAPCSDEQRAPPLSSTQGLAAEDATPPEDELPPDDEIVEEPVAVVTEEVKAPPTPPADYAVPTELTQAKQASTSGGLLWVLGILIMCAGLGLQYLYYFRLQLVENPQLRPIIAAMCDVSGCELPPRRDLGQIELTEHLMQFHPTYEESLLLTATLANSADFAQPYPLLEVIMTDIEQHVVAHRHFPPEQYIRNYREGDNFPANSEVPLMLEVLDPGNSAVGFEFRFY